MSLDFSFKKCIDNGTLKMSDLQYTQDDGTESWSAMAFSMPWNAAFIGLGSITEDNVDEVWRRTYLAQCVWGTVARVGGEPYYLTEQHIRACIGFSCNVSPESPAAFNKRLMDTTKWSPIGFIPLTCSECGSIAHGLREDGRCPNCNPFEKAEEESK